MVFLAILFALSILVIEYTIAQKFLEKDASILVYAGGIVVVLFIAIIDGLLFTMGLTKKSTLRQPILAFVCQAVFCFWPLPG